MQFPRLPRLWPLRQAPFSRWFGLYFVANICGQWSTLVCNDVLLRKLFYSLRKTFNFHKEWKETWFPHVFVHKTRHMYMYTPAMARGAKHLCARCASDRSININSEIMWMQYKPKSDGEDGGCRRKNDAVGLVGIIYLLFSWVHLLQLSWLWSSTPAWSPTPKAPEDEKATLPKHKIQTGFS